MKIETKFDIGNKVYIIHKNAIHEFVISDITILVSGTYPFILYNGSLSSVQLEGIQEDRLFKTKESAVKQRL